jgi:hypothetical protein
MWHKIYTALIYNLNLVTYCHVYQWLKMGVRVWMNGFIYSLYAPPVITSNYSAIAISALYDSCYTHASRLLVTQLKHRNYKSLTELQTWNITHN